MPLKASGPATELEAIDRFDGGVGWLAHPEERMQRASHALAVGGSPGATDDAVPGSGEPADVWVVDPVDAPGVDDLLSELGVVRGVVVLLDRHTRDAATVARRHDVPVYVPSFLDVDVGANVERFAGELPGTDFEVVQTVNWPGWGEAALYDGETLVVADALGTASYFTTGGERVGVHPMLRVLPPDVLRSFRPERVLTGHGRGVMENGERALRYALDGARARAPALWLEALKSFF